MKEENPLKDSINKRMEEERYQFPKEKKEKKQFNMQIIVLISVLISLGLIILRLIQFFME
ncbi:hypothetical protein [Streptococcus oriscaviae]|uniref:Accessory secretory protein Asp4 n=1 Tax=Streptococcus oriscaviae TaxID=2781599 RepID=A0ABX7YLG1_9STRE|nr:hypothetical protein [Streptococcus oriscaviae]QUE54658.1 hypothetical protein INT76_01855 [Streptococcus oriscaviae]